MSLKETEQMIVLDKLVNKQISLKNAALQLSLTPRWVREKAKKYSSEGAHGLVHRNRGKPSKKRLCQRLRTFFLELLQGPWEGFGPTFTADKLLELYGIKVSSEAIRQLMAQEGIRKPKKNLIDHGELEKNILVS